MDPISLFAILIWIIVISKVIAHWIRVVDVLMYIILGFLASKFWIIDYTSEIIHFLSEIWVLFLMFYAGWHEDGRTFIKKVIDNKWVALIWAIWPFVWAYFWTNVLGFSFNESIVAWFVFTATAVPYTVAILQSLKLHKTPAAKSILAAAMADDFISIITMSAVFSTFVLIQAWDVNITSILLGTWLKLLLLLLCFLIFIFLATIIFPHKHKDFKNTKWLKKIYAFVIEVLGLKWFTKKYYNVEILVPTVLFIMLFLSTFSHLMWLHAAIWAYLTWLILDPDMFHDWKKESWHACESDYSWLTWVIYSLANHFLWPIFFISLGAQLVIDFSNASTIFLYGFVLFIFISVSQFISAAWAAKYTAWLSNKDSILVWFWMWPRDVLALVILWIAIGDWLISKTLADWSENLFPTIIVVTILFLNIATPIAIKWLSKKY